MNSKEIARGIGFLAAALAVASVAYFTNGADSEAICWTAGLSFGFVGCGDIIRAISGD